VNPDQNRVTDDELGARWSAGGRGGDERMGLDRVIAVEEVAENPERVSA